MLAFGADGYVDVLAEFVEEVEEAVDGEFFEAAMHQVGDAGSVGAVAAAAWVWVRPSLLIRL